VNSNTDACIGDLEHCLSPVPALSNRDLALEREFEGFRQQVEHDLFPHLPIDLDRLVQILALDVEAQSAALGRRAESAGQVASECRLSRFIIANSSLWNLRLLPQATRLRDGACEMER